MSLLSLLSCSVRSFVDTAHGEKTVKLPLKEGDGGHISLDRLIAEKVPQLKEGSWFWQSPLLGNGHLQTIYGTMAANDHIDRVYYGRRLVTWDDDGSTVSVDYVIDPPKSRAAWDEALKYCPIPDPPPYPVRTRYLTEDEIADLRTKEDKPLAIVLHGMSGGSHESYVRAMVSTLSSEKYGLDCMVLNSRGCARTRITTPQLFCGISTDDVRRLVRLVHKEQPNRRIYLIGFSLGAAIAANYLGQEGEDTAVTAAALLACPWDFVHCFSYLEHTYLGRNIYSAQMARNLLKLIKNHRQTLADHPVVQEGRNHTVRYMHEFDETYTAPFFGFDTSCDYYRSASPESACQH